MFCSCLKRSVQNAPYAVNRYALSHTRMARSSIDAFLAVFGGPRGRTADYLIESMVTQPKPAAPRRFPTWRRRREKVQLSFSTLNLKSNQLVALNCGTFRSYSFAISALNPLCIYPAALRSLSSIRPCPSLFDCPARMKTLRSWQMTRHKSRRD